MDDDQEIQAEFDRWYATVFHEREDGDHVNASADFRAGWLAARRARPRAGKE